MITVRLRSDTGCWQEYDLPIERSQLESARRRWRLAAREWDAFDRAHPSRAVALEFLRAAGADGLGGFDALVASSAVTASPGSFRWA